MDHNTILITRTLSASDAHNLRQKLGELWPGERFTIIHGEMLTVEDIRRAWAGPQEYKAMDSTPIPRYEA